MRWFNPRDLTANILAPRGNSQNSHVFRELRPPPRVEEIGIMAFQIMLQQGIPGPTNEALAMDNYGRNMLSNRANHPPM